MNRITIYYLIFIFILYTPIIWLMDSFIKRKWNRGICRGCSLGKWNFKGYDSGIYLYSCSHCKGILKSSFLLHPISDSQAKSIIRDIKLNKLKIRFNI